MNLSERFVFHKMLVYRIFSFITSFIREIALLYKHSHIIMAEYYVEHLRLVEGKEQVKSYIWYPGPNSNVENKCPDVHGEIQA